MVSYRLGCVDLPDGHMPVFGINCLWSVYITTQTLWGSHLDWVWTVDAVSFPSTACWSCMSLTLPVNSGAGLTLLFHNDTNPGVIAVIVAVMGVGIGFTFQPTLVAFQAHSTKSQRAVVISDRNFFRCLGGACGLAVSAALLQATLRSSLPQGYQYLSDSTYSLPSKSEVPDADWTQILDAYVQASRSVFTLQVPLIGACFIACIFIRDRGLERPKEPGEDEEKKEPSTSEQVGMKGQPEDGHDVESGYQAQESTSAVLRHSAIIASSQAEASHGGENGRNHE